MHDDGRPAADLTDRTLERQIDLALAELREAQAPAAFALRVRTRLAQLEPGVRVPAHPISRPILRAALAASLLLATFSAVWWTAGRPDPRSQVAEQRVPAASHTARGLARPPERPWRALGPWHGPAATDEGGPALDADVLDRALPRLAPPPPLQWAALESDSREPPPLSTSLVSAIVPIADFGTVAPGGRQGDHP